MTAFEEPAKKEITASFSRNCWTSAMCQIGSNLISTKYIWTMCQGMFLYEDLKSFFIEQPSHFIILKFF